MLKRKLTARPIEYYGNAVSEMLKAERSLENARKSLDRAYDFLQDQEQLLSRFKEDSRAAKNAKEMVDRVIKSLEKFYDEVDDCAYAIELCQQEYHGAK